MRITANMLITHEEKDRALYTEEEWDNLVYRDLVIKFAQELQKMTPLLAKGDEDRGTRYQVQGIVLSMDTFKTLMERLQTDLSYEEFDEVRNIFNNTI
jgi:uncharacterized protein YjaG (DUF416 family)